MKLLITGGAGFIGSGLIHHLMGNGLAEVVNVDKLTYAASPASVASFLGQPGYAFEQADICDRDAMRAIFRRHRPNAIIHLAAESHVDRSIDDAGAFILTNVVGTYTLLDVALEYWRELKGADRESFRFHHVSTDEVYGSLGSDGHFLEETPYRPNSPYAASKASSDHLVRAWYKTHGLPVVLTNCSNNYGPRQFPEKLIPLMTLKSLAGERLPVYGTGTNVRDWLYVEDHASALHAVVTRGRLGENYNIGGNNEFSNLTIVESICDLVDEMVGRQPGGDPRRALISFVTDRPGHDFRYAIDAGKIMSELGWQPSVTFPEGLRKTIAWYLDNRDWWQPLVEKNAVQRVGIRTASAG